MSKVVPAPESVVQAAALLVREHMPLYERRKSGDSMLNSLMKADVVPKKYRASRQGVMLGRKAHPYDMRQVMSFQTSNEHHSTCIKTKTAATVGLGFRDEEDDKQPKIDPVTMMPEQLPSALTRLNKKPSKADLVLDPLCEHSFQDVINDVAEDYHQVGNGYLEIVRKGNKKINGPITGIHHLSAPDVYVFLEDLQYNMHFEVVGCEGLGGSRHFAAFGDKEDFIARSRANSSVVSYRASRKPDQISEVIHFRKPSSMHRWYGFDDWLSCVPTIELCQMFTQHTFDFFLNRGVPEFMLFILGAKLEKDDWKKVEDAIRANIGLGNSHKSMALNLTNPNIKIQLEKLAMDSKGDKDVGDLTDAAAVRIVTAHRVPPLLAGIMVPGKLGASNELPNALMAFQALVISGDQRIFTQKLGNTLGNEAINGGLGLTRDDFIFREITEVIDVGTMDTTSRMRESIPAAKAKGRDLSTGVKD